MFTQLIIIMQTIIDTRSAVDVIKDTYDYETCKEIVEHGCVSGVAHDHIYYKDTLSFFDKYEDEMIEYITDTLGDDVVEEMWTNNSNNITGYKNDVTWSFIELVAVSIVDGVDALEDDELYAVIA